MNKKNIPEVIEAIQKSMELMKCRKCGCMKKSLESMKGALDASNNDYTVLIDEIQNALDLTETSEYT